MNKAPWSDTHDFKFTTDNSVTSAPKGGHTGTTQQIFTQKATTPRPKLLSFHHCKQFIYLP